MQQTKKIKMADAISPYLAVSCGLIYKHSLWNEMVIHVCQPTLPPSVPLLPHRGVVKRRSYQKCNQHTIANNRGWQWKGHSKYEIRIFKEDDMIILYQQRKVFAIPQSM